MTSPSASRPRRFGVEGDAYFIVVHGVCGVSFGDEYRVASSFGDEGILSVAFALEGSCHFYAVVVEFEFAFVHFGDVVVQQHVVQDVLAKHFQWMRGQTQLFEYVFQGEYFVGFRVEKSINTFTSSFFFMRLPAFFSFFLDIVFLFFMIVFSFLYGCTLQSKQIIG